MSADHPIITTHASLAEALAAFQGEDGLTFAKTKTAEVRKEGKLLYTYKYADLSDILPVIRPLLAKHGLSWRSKPILTDSGDMHLWYRLEHVGGDTDTGQVPLGVKGDCKPQELGSAITYMRRYALTAQLNLATEEDDDAQAAQTANRGRVERNGHAGGQPIAAEPKPSERPASSEQKRDIRARARLADLTSAELANTFLAAAGEGVRLWEDDATAARWADRQLDRLPAALVDKVLEGIDAKVPF